MTADPDCLAAVEEFFAAPRYDYETFTLASKRKLRVIGAVDVPWEGITTYISFDGTKVEWPGVRAGFRLLPIVPVLRSSDQDSSGAFHAAHLLDWSLSKGVPPAPRDVVLTLGHGDTLVHIRFDYPFPWEHEQPAKISCGELSLMPVMAYSVSDAEARLQHREGPDALEARLQETNTQLFDRRRACSLT